MTDHCVGCGHPLAKHFRDVTGVARCIWEQTELSTEGIQGLPYTNRCDCADFVSLHYNAVRQLEARQQEERRQAAEQFAKLISKDTR